MSLKLLFLAAADLAALLIFPIPLTRNPLAEGLWLLCVPFFFRCLGADVTYISKARNEG